MKKKYDAPAMTRVQVSSEGCFCSSLVKEEKKESEPMETEMATIENDITFS